MATRIGMYRNLHRVLSFLVLVAAGQVALAGEAAVEFDFPDAMRAWTVPEVPSVPVTVRLPQSGQKAWARLTISDWQGKVEQKFELPVAKENERLTFRPRQLQAGWYDVQVAVGRDDAVLAKTQTSFAILQPMPTRLKDVSPLDCTFGVCVHMQRDYYNRPETYRLLRLGSLHWVRDDLSWDVVEREQAGQYAVPSGIRERCEKLRAEGIRSLLVLGYGNKFHKHATSEEPPAFEKYVEFTARELAGVVDHFEIWNEPNGFGRLTPELYPAILKAGYRGVKKGNPEAFVVGIGGSSPGGWGGHYIHDGIYKQNAAGFMDTFSIHPYLSPWAPETGYRSEGAPAPLACLATAESSTFGLASQIAKAKNLPEPPGIWITEQGWPVGGEVDLADQAQAISRACLFVAAHPKLYGRYFLYDFVCDGTDLKEAEHNFGVLNHDLSPRPAYVAMTVALRMVEARPLLQRLESPRKDVQAPLFGPEEDSMLAVWATETHAKEKIANPDLGKAGSAMEKTVPVTLVTKAENITITDWQGRSRKVLVQDGKVQLTLTTWPQYVTGAGSDVQILPVGKN